MAMSRLKNNCLERFWTKVDVRGPDECWPWLAAITDGYGRFCPHSNSLNRLEQGSLTLNT